MNSELSIYRYPPSSDKSLKAWASADTHILNLLASELPPESSISVINDRFGYLSINLISNTPNVITHFKSQEDAIHRNLASNNLDSKQLNFSCLLDKSQWKSDFIVLKIPKSMDLFHLFIQKAHALAKAESKVLCGFMTRHFTKQMLEIAALYFDQVNQSLAWKKSRVLMLSRPKSGISYIPALKTISYLNHREENQAFKQYFGVFSANHIDYATQFLLENLKIDSSIKRALDLASGNGVIAHEIRSQSKDVELHLMDDAHLAIESSKLNLTEEKTFFHYTYNLDHFEDEFFDLVVSNPPFHFEYENTIEIALRLFTGVSRVLSQNGSFILVANLHLNYKTHLRKIFNNVSTLNMNSKFEIIVCKN